eukprot:COSAG01_NODE_11869_length_1844_cov_3.174785_2_plen_115_part_00
MRPEQPRGSPPRARNYYHRFGLRGWRSQLPRPQAAAAGQAGGKQAGGLHNCVSTSAISSSACLADALYVVAHGWQSVSASAATPAAAGDASVLDGRSIHPGPSCPWIQHGLGAR